MLTKHELLSLQTTNDIKILYSQPEFIDGQSFLLRMKDDLIIQPKTFQLALSKEVVAFSTRFSGYIFGISALCRRGLHFYEGKVHSGFIGRIVFEFFNGGDEVIELKEGDKVAHLTVFRLNNSEKYLGEWQFQYIEDNELLLLEDVIKHLVHDDKEKKSIDEQIRNRVRIEEFYHNIRVKEFIPIP